MKEKLFSKKKNEGKREKNVYHLESATTINRTETSRHIEPYKFSSLIFFFLLTCVLDDIHEIHFQWPLCDEDIVYSRNNKQDLKFLPSTYLGKTYFYYALNGKTIFKCIHKRGGKNSY